MSDVKRFWADLCVHHVEAVLYSDYAALEAELAKLRAGKDGWKLVPVEPTPEMVSAAEEAHMPFGDMDIALRMAVLAAPSAPATVQGDGWIPVSERLPEPETDVLVRVVLHNGIIHSVAGMFHGVWMTQETEDETRGEITHWMPLPAAPARQEVK